MSDEKDDNSYKKKSLLARQAKNKKFHKRLMRILSSVIAVLIVLSVVLFVTDGNKINVKKESVKAENKGSEEKLAANDTDTPTPTPSPTVKPTETPMPSPSPTPKYKLLEFTKV